MTGDRRTQPYRRGARQPGAALTAMLKGATASGYNPADINRAAALMAAAGKHRRARASSRPPLPARPQRPPLPPR